jgi:nicotinamidase-related amidase
MMNSSNAERNRSGSLATRSDTILIVIDVQERLVPAIAGGDQVADNIRRLLTFAGIAGLPVILTEQEKLGATLANIAGQLPVCRPIPKISFNCFRNDEFSRQVRESGRKILVLTGVEAHICVTQTALYALPDFRVHVVQDAIGSRTRENRDIAIERLRANGVTMTSTEMFIYEILEKAGTEEFKAVLPLVK